MSHQLLSGLTDDEKIELIGWALEFLAAKDTSQYALRARFPAVVITGENPEWRGVYGYKDLYEVSNSGTVRNQKTKKEITQSILTAGHRQVGLMKNKKRKSHYIHRLVAHAFVVKRNPTHVVVNHIDGNPANNMASNLEWTTQKKNIKQPAKEVKRLKTLNEVNNKSGTLKRSLNKLADNYAELLGGK